MLLGLSHRGTEREEERERKREGGREGETEGEKGGRRERGEGEREVSEVDAFVGKLAREKI